MPGLSDFSALMQLHSNVIVALIIVLGLSPKQGLV